MIELITLVHEVELEALQKDPARERAHDRQEIAGLKTIGRPNPFREIADHILKALIAALGGGHELIRLLLSC